MPRLLTRVTRTSRAARHFLSGLLDTDHPLAPSYVRDQTPLRKGQITTAMLRNLHAALFGWAARMPVPVLVGVGETARQPRSPPSS